VFDAPRDGFVLLAARARCWLGLSLLPASTPRSLSAVLLSSHSSPSLYMSSIAQLYVIFLYKDRCEMVKMIGLTSSDSLESLVAFVA